MDHLPKAEHSWQKINISVKRSKQNTNYKWSSNCPPLKIQHAPTHLEIFWRLYPWEGLHFSHFLHILHILHELHKFHKFYKFHILHTLHILHIYICYINSIYNIDSTISMNSIDSISSIFYIFWLSRYNNLYIWVVHHIIYQIYMAIYIHQGRKILVVWKWIGEMKW